MVGILRVGRLLAGTSLGSTAFTPASLFAASEPGGWYDPSDLATLYQDAAGTTPVTAVEQPVGLVLDKSRGLVASTKGGQITGASGSGFDTPSAAANQITSDIDIRVQASMVSWASANTVFCSRIFTGVTTADAYEFWISSTGVLRLLLVSGTTATDVSSSVSVGFAAGTTNWVRVTWQQSTGYVNFYTSSDGVTWTQNGAANRAGQTSAINAGTRFLRIGARTEGNFTLNGKIYRAQIYNGINGTLAADFNPTLYSGGATFTAATSEVWTIAGTARIVPDGAHLSQSTAAARPVLSARVNIIPQYSEDISNAAWTKTNATAPNATTLQDTNATGFHFVKTADTISYTSGVSYTLRVRLEKGTVGFGGAHIVDNAGTARGCSINLTTGDIGTPYGGATAVSSADGSGWVLTITASAGATGLGNAAIYMSTSNALASYTGTGSGTIRVYSADLRPANAGVGLPAYQRVGAATDYDTTGFPLYLKFDGTDDFLQSSTITPGSVDKAQVFAGVRKLSDANAGALVSWGTYVSGNTFELQAPSNAATGNYQWVTHGNGSNTTDNDFNAYRFNADAPVTSVVTATADRSITNTAGVSARLNGALANRVSTTSTGTNVSGNFDSAALSVGQRSNNTTRLNANLYSLILRFSAANLDAATITATETWVNGKTRAF